MVLTGQERLGQQGSYTIHYFSALLQTYICDILFKSFKNTVYILLFSDDH